MNTNKFEQTRKTYPTVEIRHDSGDEVGVITVWHKVKNFYGESILDSEAVHVTAYDNFADIKREIEKIQNRI